MKELLIATVLIANFEGFEPCTYLDIANVPTIGYGHVVEEYNPNHCITKEQGLKMLESDVRKFRNAILDLTGENLSQNQLDATTSLVYNIGIGAFKSSTLLKYIKQGDMAKAADEFLRWNKARVDGKLQEVDGLTNRRIIERNLFMK